MGKRKNNRKKNKNITQDSSHNGNYKEKSYQNFGTGAIKDNQTVTESDRSIPICSLTPKSSLDYELVEELFGDKEANSLKENVPSSSSYTKKKKSILKCSSQMLVKTEGDNLDPTCRVKPALHQHDGEEIHHKNNMFDNKVSQGKDITLLASKIETQTVSRVENRKSTYALGTRNNKNSQYDSDLELMYGLKSKASNTMVNPSKKCHQKIEPSNYTDRIEKDYRYKQISGKQISLGNSEVENQNLLDNYDTRTFEGLRDTDDLKLMYGVKPKKSNPLSNPSTKYEHGKGKVGDVYQTENKILVSRSLPQHVDSRVDAFSKNDFHINSNRKDKDQYRNFTSCNSKPNENPDFDRNIEKFKENVCTSINAYNRSENIFSGMCQNWLQTRKDTIKKLNALILDLHNDQLNFNKAQKMCREAGLVSRQVKSAAQYGTLGFLASVSAFASDAASGIASVAQALNVDTYQAKFEEIIDADAEITKSLTEARSRCIEKYHGVEEIIRKIPSNTLNSTLGEVSNALEVSKFWEAIKTASKTDDTNKVMSLLGDFVNRGCQSEVLAEVYNSVETYVNENPAALDACKSAGRAVYGVIESLGVNKNRSAVGRGMSTFSNVCLIHQDALEISQLQCTIDENKSQTRLEDKIQMAVDSLESEMKEMVDSYFQQFGNSISDEYDDDEYLF